jgi:hypothetical protein
MAAQALIVSLCLRNFKFAIFNFQFAMLLFIAQIPRTLSVGSKLVRQ